MKEPGSGEKRLKAGCERLEEIPMRSVKYFETIIECMGDPIFVKDQDYRFVFVNDAACGMRGLSAEQTLGKTDYDLFPREQADVFRAHDKRVLETGEKDINEEQVIDAQGNLLTIITAKTLYTNEKGKKYIVGVIRDITERKRTEMSLIESEIKYRAAVENSLAGVYIYQENLFRFVNRRYCEMYGYTYEEMVDKMGPVDIAHPDDRDIMREHMGKLVSGELDDIEVTHRCVRKDGKVITVHVLGSLMIFKGWPAVAGTVLDVTEQEESQRELRRKTALLEAQLNASPDGIVIVDEGKAILQNQRANDLFKFPKRIAGNDDIGRRIKWIKGLVKNPMAFQEKLIYTSSHQGETVREEVELKDGTVLDGYSGPVIGNDGKRYGRIWTFRDITQYRRSEEALRRSELRLSEAMDLAKIVYWEADPEKDIFTFNDRFYAFYGTTAEQEGGYRMARDEYAKRFVHPDDLPIFYGNGEQNVAMSESEFVVVIEHRIIRRDGKVRYVLARVKMIKDNSGRVITVHGANQDITERKLAVEEKTRLESQLLQAQKMEAMGVLAGGIAHDFNNVLAGIIGFAEMIKEDTPADSRQYRRIELVLKGAHRGRDLVKQILTFCRQTKQEQEYVRLSGIVEEALQLIRPTLPATIEIRFTCLTQDDGIYADSGQIHQVLMNLCTNAAHAMRKKKGILEIEVSNSTVTQADQTVPFRMEPGRYVTLTVRDTGCGMPPETVQRVFDPFFTTKRKGEGTGLGLSVVHGIIKSHGGYVNVRSEPGKGSTFVVFLPEIAGPAGDLETKAPQAAGGRERILFVDDEDVLVDLNRERLNRLGYHVVTTTNSLEALELVEKDPHGFDLVITDYTMPYLTGLDLAAEMRRVRPDLPIIICTGYNDNLSRELAKSAGIQEFLLKPQSKDDLARAIRRVLGSGAEE